MSENDTSNVDIDYVAGLARIQLTEEEKATFSEQLHEVLEHFKKLQEIDVEAIEPTAHAFPSFNIWQEDTPAEAFTPEEALRNAPAQRQNQIVVPKVIDDA